MSNTTLYFFSVTYQFPDSVENKVDLFFSNSVMPASIIISGVLLAAYQLLRVK